MPRCKMCDVLLLPDREKNPRTAHPTDCRLDTRYWIDALVYWTKGFRPLAIRKSKVADRFLGTLLDEDALAHVFALMTPDYAEHLAGLSEAAEQAHKRSMYDSPPPRQLQKSFTTDVWRNHARDGRYLLRNVWQDPIYLPLHTFTYVAITNDIFGDLNWTRAMLLDIKPEYSAKFGDLTLPLGEEPSRPMAAGTDPYSGQPLSYSLVTERNSRPVIRTGK